MCEFMLGDMGELPNIKLLSTHPEISEEQIKYIEMNTRDLIFALHQKRTLLMNGDYTRKEHH